MMLIWLHGIPASSQPMSDLFDALSAIGKEDVAGLSPFLTHDSEAHFYDFLSRKIQEESRRGEFNLLNISQEKSTLHSKLFSLPPYTLQLLCHIVTIHATSAPFFLSFLNIHMMIIE